VEYELTSELAREGVTDPLVLAALMRVERSAFVPKQLLELAHENSALPIGHGQTISQPFIVAVMTSALGVKPGERVLEVGTGSGYQAAVLVEYGCEVYSIERIQALAERAALALLSQDYRVRLKVGDGALGWREEAPFDGIVVTAGATEIPRQLVNQLKEGRRLVIPLGEPDAQRLFVVTRHGAKYTLRGLMDVRFVPLIRD
jgi:protein-L-isoaspartate(D-aspartate) O-methyltransferase